MMGFQFVNVDQFTRGIRRFAENVSPYVPVYFYVFGYMGQIVGENPYDGKYRVGIVEDGRCFVF